MDLLFSIILVVFGVLQIILFFKLWGMTNDVREIKNLLSLQKYSNSDDTHRNMFSYGDKVKLKKSGKVLMAKSYNSDIKKYNCYSPDGKVYEGSFSQSELESVKDSSVDSNGFSVGDLVVNKETGKQMRITYIKGGKYACYTNGGTVHEGNFSANEIKKFED